MKKQKSFRFNGAIIFSLILDFSLTGASADTFYVSASGSDNNSGTSATQSWQSLAKANGRLNPGDTVLISAGEYSDQIRPARSGASHTARVTYKALGDGQVILTAVGNTSKGSAEDVGAIALGGRRGQARNRGYRK